MKALKIVKKHYKSVLLIVAVVGILYFCFSLIHDIATAQRGYEAVGGEIFIFLLPYLVYVAVQNFKDAADIKKHR